MSKKKEKSVLNKIIIVSICVVLSIYVISMILPIFWGLYNSLKSPMDFFMGNVLGFPNLDPNGFGNSREEFFELKNFQVFIENFDQVLQTAKTRFYTMGGQLVYHEATGGIPGIFVNTIIYIFLGSLFTTIVPAITAYAVAKFDFKFSHIAYTVLLMAMIIPVVGNQSTMINVLQATNLFDTWYGFIFWNSGAGGMYFFVLYGFYKGLPDSYAEAAEIDGASYWNILTTVILPLSIKQLSTIWLIHIVEFWNDYQTPLLYLPSHPTLAFSVWYLAVGSNRLGDLPTKAAGTMTLAVPILILFIFLKNKLMGSVSVGGLKE